MLFRMPIGVIDEMSVPVKLFTYSVLAVFMRIGYTEVVKSMNVSVAAGNHTRTRVLCIQFVIMHRQYEQI